MIRFYNTISRKKENFTPIVNGEVSLYTCGPTVYDYAHIGNFRAYIFEDLLRRFLEAKNFKVQHIMNITDIDDKTIRRSIDEKLSLTNFTNKYTDAFHEDVEALNILPAHNYPRATEFIDEMIDIIKGLESKGYTYLTEDGSVFFKISKFKEYGRLANLDPEQLKVGERVEQDEYGKEEGRDFALWKGYKEGEGEIYWESPWGKGRPGWHIECSAMSMHYLGDHFDIHCGGVDNIFPHHENEIAQSCAFSDNKFVNYWMHNEHLMVESEKMSKSLGNFYTFRQLIDRGISPEAIRYTLISIHYRQKLNFTFDKVQASQKAINKLRELKRRVNLIDNADGLDYVPECRTMVKSFLDTLSDDLNISGALGQLFIWVNKTFSLIDNNALSASSKVNIVNALDKVDSIIGVVNYSVKDSSIDQKIEKLIKMRDEARSKKDWSKADEIRNKIYDLGVVIEDTSEGTIWKKR